MLGHVIGKYRIVASMDDQGPIGLYRAEDTETGKRLAILNLPVDLPVRRIEQLRAAIPQGHRYVAQVLEGGDHDGQTYLVLALAEGETLTARLAKRRRLPMAATLDIGMQICAAMAAVHVRGLIHLDLSPSSVFLTRHGVRVFGFGVRQALASEGAGAAADPALAATPYSSPERVSGVEPLDRRADIYSLGCILLHMAWGRPPFSGRTAAELASAHLYAPLPELDAVATTVPRPLAALILSMLDKDPGSRPQSMMQVQTALLDAAADLEPTHPQPD